MADRRRRRHRDDGTALSGRPPDAQRLQYEERQERADPVKRDGRDEDGHPAARDSLQDVSEGHEQRCRALRRVEEAVVGGRKLAAKEVAARRGEQAVDLSPGEEHQTREHDEQRRDVGKGDEKQDPHSLEPEGNEHRVLAADMIGDPAKEWACEAVQEDRKSTRLNSSHSQISYAVFCLKKKKKKKNTKKSSNQH